jgi:hypothetical protein
LLRSKVHQGVKCVEKQSELGIRVLQEVNCDEGQSVAKEQSVLGSKVFIQIKEIYYSYFFDKLSTVLAVTSPRSY